MSKTYMERNHERIARVREEYLQRRFRKVQKDPRWNAQKFTVIGEHETLIWDETGARQGIVVTLTPNRKDS